MVEHQPFKLWVLGSSPSRLTLRRAQGFAQLTMNWFTYILLCDQKTYYVGITHNLGQRVESHKSKQNMGTMEFSDLQLVYYESYLTRKEAERREKQLKGWTVAKKKALIAGNVELLKRLSRNRELVDG